MYKYRISIQLKIWPFLTGCLLDIAFFPRILQSLPPLPIYIGCTKNYQPIGLTVHSHCIESFEGLLQQCRRRRGCSELWKNTIFSMARGYVDWLIYSLLRHRKQRKGFSNWYIISFLSFKVNSLKYKIVCHIIHLYKVI